MVLILKHKIIDFLEINRDRAFTVREIAATLEIKPPIVKALVAEMHRNREIIQMGKKGLVYTYTARMVPEIES